ncbi:hypothetical protein C7M61_000276 [Candidozyma pseudohaemuli]|uniref:Uncharacterized protein n=1 Tax=Candidozyma pseudohaemuli TaxID=418784 RepID=A0A2P7YXD9_9ASCO|nr:hypothetical protein C7M61_000276 [[Candida] pseudohaemulonii]PSK40628.1 hypothetical protein C7M61_000276 [[Candida] pseudohaemulonii]
MSFRSTQTIRGIRAFTSSAIRHSYEQQLAKSAENINVLLENSDRLSYILAQYIPEPARNGFLAIKAFGLEINKITDGGAATGSRALMALNQLSSSMGLSTADMKYKFWLDMMSKAFTDQGEVHEPTVFLLRDALRLGLNLDISYFHQYLQTRRHFLLSKQFKTVEDICSYGEGTYSQLNYATQALLLLPLISPSVIHLLELSPQLQNKVSDIAAHIGQASAVSSMILGFEYYASTRNIVTLPVDLMTKFELSQETALRLAQGHLKEKSQEEEAKEKLQNVIFETAVTANDHLLSARVKLKEVKNDIAHLVKSKPHDSLLQKNVKKWRRGIPDVVFIPFMNAIPTSLYLEKLEKNDFNLFRPGMKQKEWRLGWRSFKNYYTRSI